MIDQHGYPSGGRVFPGLGQRKTHRLSLAEIRFRARSCKISDPGNIPRSFRDTDGAARVQHVERVRALEHVVVTRREDAEVEQARCLGLVPVEELPVQRDIGLVENAVRGSRKSESLQVSDACVLDAYVVDLSSRLDRVLAEMADRHIGSALVVKHGKLAGIFTTSDACHHFGRFLAQFFESAVEQWMGRISPLCIFGPICGKGVAIEHDGSVYSCDHYVYPEYRLGSIQDESIDQMVLSERQVAFGYAKDSALPGQCRRCDYLFACAGECPKNRFIRTPDGEPGLNYLCSGWKRFFSHADEQIRKIVRDIGETVTIPETERVVRLDWTELEGDKK